MTLAGATHAARVGASLLMMAGLGELVATSPDDYVALAVALAGDRDRLRRLRQNARSRLAREGLVDGKRPATAFARAVRVAWRALVR